ncbi:MULTISPECIES: FAD-dependent monooxygenase [Actinomadura]|uniref:Monooxygenase n=1 Tax=Actinomadura litoris TaxID=2678616 RepID=A0A7K1L1W8_9ACTN|nr:MULTISPECIES: FAD-dependent monooxygenase [Actinomadura]MBT2208991.1 FAD-dependent monooxygenase [Actinomadura sp. NEAU-AAG7]MUN38444.1 monooxygenase [Actinomadura litoris]
MRVPDDGGVAIVGGGIGGLTAAVALRGIGVRTTVHERAPDLGRIQTGGGLMLWHNAVRALHLLGLRDELAKIGHEIRAQEFHSWRGRRLARWPVAEISERTGVPVYAVSRPELHRMLTGQVGADLRLGSRCTGFATGRDGATLRLSRSGGRSEEVHRDLLVGADGLRSTVRAALMPYEPPPRYAGYTAWQGVVPDPGVRPGVFVNIWGRGRRFVYYPLADGLVYWDAITSDRIGHGLDALGATGGEIVTEQFAGWPDPVAALVAATPPEEITPIDIYDRDPVRRWSTGRVTLLGDAAHPMAFNLGQGGCQSIEDALVLRQCVDEAGPTGAALELYERRRLPRTTTIVRRSRAIGSLSRWQNPALCRVREGFMRIAFRRLVYRKTADLITATDY